MPDWRPDERLGDPLAVPGGGDLARAAPSPPPRRARAESVTSTAAAITSCSAWLIRSAATCTGSAVSSARIAISVGPASESMPITALEQPLGRGDPDVAGAGDHGGARALLGAVGEHRHRLGAAHGVDLVDAEQRARGEDERVRQPAELGLGGRGDRERGHARLLGGHHVHDHAGGVDGPAARHVQPDPLDRHPPLGDRAARHDLGGDVGAPLVAVDQAGAADRLLQGRAHPRVELGQRVARSPRRAPGWTPARRRRTAAVSSRTAAAPRWRTSSQIGRTFSRAASTSSSARGSTSRRSPGRDPRRSIREITPPVYGPRPPVPASSGMWDGRVEAPVSRPGAFTIVDHEMIAPSRVAPATLAAVGKAKSKGGQGTPATVALTKAEGRLHPPPLRARPERPGLRRGGGRRARRAVRADLQDARGRGRERARGRGGAGRRASSTSRRSPPRCGGKRAALADAGQGGAGHRLRGRRHQPARAAQDACRPWSTSPRSASRRSTSPRAGAACRSRPPPPS